MTTIYQHADFEVPDWGEFAAPPLNTPGYRTQVMAHSPLAYWRLGETTGNAAADTSGQGHHGTYQSGCLLNQSGALHFDDDPAVYFDGNAAHMQVPSSFTLTVNDPITLMFWNYVQTSDLKSAIAVWLGSQTEPNRCLTHAPWSDGTLYWYYGRNNSLGRIITDYTAYLDRWTHITLVSAGQLGSFKAIYLDGELAASDNTSDGPTQTLTGGSLSVSPSRLANVQHRGRLDEVAVFNQVLSAQDIRSIYQAGANPWA